MPDRGWTAEWEKKAVRKIQAAAKASGPPAEGSSGLDDEFGALGVQAEGEQEDGGEEKAKRTRSRNKQKKKKK